MKFLIELPDNGEVGIDDIELALRSHAPEWAVIVTQKPDNLDDPVYVLVQEGGATGELYVHAHDTEGEAIDDRFSCSDASYRTTEIFEVPKRIADQPGFYEAVEEIVRAVVLDLDYPGDDERPQWFVNHYRHAGCPETKPGAEDPAWTDEHSSMCNDRCPQCNAEIEPCDSEDQTT